MLHLRPRVLRLVARQDWVVSRHQSRVVRLELMERLDGCAALRPSDLSVLP